MIDKARMLELRRVMTEAYQLSQGGNLDREAFERLLERANVIFPDRPDLVEPIFYFARAEWGSWGALDTPRRADDSSSKP